MCPFPAVYDDKRGLERLYFITTVFRVSLNPGASSR